MTTFHPRPQVLPGRAPVASRLSLRSRDENRNHRGQTFHHVGDGGALFHPDPFQRLRGIYDYHVHTLGYGDIAYLGAFDAGGHTYGLRYPNYVQAHAQSTDNIANRYTDGVVFLEDARGWTTEALGAFAWWTQLYLLARGHVPSLWAHTYWGRHGGLPTACPAEPIISVVKFCGGIV